jgi:hypothetical protein
LEVAFTDKQWSYITELAHISRAPKAAVVRTFVERGISPLRDTPMPARYRADLGPVTIAASEEALT